MEGGTAKFRTEWLLGAKHRIRSQWEQKRIGGLDGIPLLRQPIMPELLRSQEERNGVVFTDDLNERNRLLMELFQRGPRGSAVFFGMSYGAGTPLLEYVLAMEETVVVSISEKVLRYVLEKLMQDLKWIGLEEDQVREIMERRIKGVVTEMSGLVEEVARGVNEITAKPNLEPDEATFEVVKLYEKLGRENPGPSFPKLFLPICR